MKYHGKTPLNNQYTLFKKMKDRKVKQVLSMGGWVPVREGKGNGNGRRMNMVHVLCIDYLYSNFIFEETEGQSK
jgi:hypothetical protein